MLYRWNEVNRGKIREPGGMKEVKCAEVGIVDMKEKLSVESAMHINKKYF